MRKIITIFIFIFSFKGFSKEIKGEISGFGHLPKDGVVDYVFTVPSLNSNTIPFFHIDHQMQGSLETIKILGRTYKVPSFLSFPKQKEKISFITITVEKKSFSTNLISIETGLQSLHAKVSIKKLRSLSKNFKLIPFVSQFQSLKYEPHLTKSFYKLDYSQNIIPLSFKHKLIANKNHESYNLFYIALHRKNDEFLFTDMKKAQKDRHLELNSPTSEKPHIMNLLTHKMKKNYMEAYLETFLENKSPSAQSLHLMYPDQIHQIPEFLSLLPDLTLSKSILSTELPKKTEHIQAYGMQVLLWKVKSFYYKKRKLTQIKKLISKMHFENWRTSIDVSEFENLEKGHYFWQVVFQGRNPQVSQDPQFFTTNLLEFEVK